MAQAKVSVDVHKIYQLPKQIAIEKIDHYILVISTETANWLLLDNDEQLALYHDLAQGQSINSILQARTQQIMPNLITVLREIEAKHFENMSINPRQEHGMYVYLTNNCNQRCEHCYMYAGKKIEHELDTYEITKLLRDFASNDGKVVTFTGGEATLRSDLKEIVQVAKEQGLDVCILSNGLRWPLNFIQEIAEYVDEVQISIDGYDRQSYKAVRRTDSFHQVLATIERILLQTKIKVTVAITPLLATLLGNEQKYIEFAQGLTERYKEKNFSVKFSSDLFDGRNISLTDEESKLYRQAMATIKKACNITSEELDFAIDHRFNAISNNCGYGGISVAANGDVFFCNLLSSCAKQANIRDHSFNDILKLANYARQLSDVNNLKPCQSCSLKYICGGGCRVKFFKSVVKQDLNQGFEINIARDVPCSQEHKDKLLRKMIRSNEYFYYQ